MNDIHEPANAPLLTWSKDEVDTTCSHDYSVYDEAKVARLTQYFDDHPELRGNRPFCARDIPSALPSGWGELYRSIDPAGWHRWAVSGKSSQTLAVGLLGVAARIDDSLEWLKEACGPLPLNRFDRAEIRFERTLHGEVLNEWPRQTSVDIVCEDEHMVICIESKWTEKGIGTCSCEAAAGAVPCSQRVLDRPAYWRAAEQTFGLPRRPSVDSCPISLSYQAVRNVAAARALAGPERLGVFLLLHDAENPYFRQTGDWPGWPAVLQKAADSNTDASCLVVRTASWQDLMGFLPLDASTRAWAAEKYGLAASDPDTGARPA